MVILAADAWAPVSVLCAEQVDSMKNQNEHKRHIIL
jgi:hypothetical protein